MRRISLSVALVAALSGSLPGCAAITGNADYLYVRTGPGPNCRVVIESGRTVDGPTVTHINECNVSISTGGLTQGESRLGPLESLATRAMQLAVERGLGAALPPLPTSSIPTPAPEIAAPSTEQPK